MDSTTPQNSPISFISNIPSSDLMPDLWAQVVPKRAIVSVAHVNDRAGLVGKTVVFVSFTGENAFRAKVIELLEGDLAMILVDVPYLLQHVLVGEGSILAPIDDTPPPSPPLIQRLQNQWSRILDYIHDFVHRHSFEATFELDLNPRR